MRSALSLSLSPDSCATMKTRFRRFGTPFHLEPKHVMSHVSAVLAELCMGCTCKHSSSCKALYCCASQSKTCETLRCLATFSCGSGAWPGTLLQNVQLSFASLAEECILQVLHGFAKLHPRNRFGQHIGFVLDTWNVVHFQVAFGDPFLQP